MQVRVRRVPCYHPDNSGNFCAGSDYSVGYTLTGAFNKIRSTYEEIMAEGDSSVPPIGFTTAKEYYSHVCSFITGEILFFVKVKPDRSVQFLTIQQALAGIGFDS